ncbi:M48 family metalloprotease [Sulfurisphaera ohwakuensis]|uniref:M48 family metalloprotease n=1 Tax=Sulfurisphaera ohwakuensis TaxID=69656 RepID=A0A650CGD1_SULOH|nr:M48 family metalloprotease [Sulfurisphaera ohwakuensis]MBB5254219.1 hypothetical protein [Sulfurisphaera ohwakuensis]QGR16816.1 M48 family metalloprotease [Sulfurisphaera ohwakuensis]
MNKRKAVFFFSLLSILSSIFSFFIYKINPFLAQIILFMGIGFASIGMFFAALIAISLFKALFKGDLQKSVPESKSYSKNVYNPFILIVKMSLLLSFSLTLSSLFIFACFVWILHVTFITPMDLFVSIALNFLFGILFSMIVLSRVDLFKEVKPGEVKIIRVPKFVHGGLTTGVLALSLRSPFKEIIFIYDYEDESLVKTIELHELAHAKEYHPILLQIIGILLVSIIGSLLFFTPFSYIIPLINISLLLVIKTLLVVLSIGVASLLFLRVAESRADAFAFKIIGEKAYENLLEILRIHYGKNIKSTEEAPLFSRITHTSSRNALKTGDPLSSLGLWEFPTILSFVAATIAIMRANSIIIIELFPFLYIGILVILFLVGLVFLPIVKKYYGMTERGSMNFSTLLAGLYIISSMSALNGYPNIYLIIFLFLVGIALTYMIARVFLKSKKIIIHTLLIYLGINILIGVISVIRIFLHGV